MKIILLLIVIILSLYSISHAVTDYEQCGISKLCWIDANCSKPGANMILMDHSAFTTESEKNCPRFFTMRPINLNKWEVEMMDKNATMMGGVELQNEETKTLCWCARNDVWTGTSPGFAISDRNLIDDIGGGVHCIFNVSAENGLISDALKSADHYFFQDRLALSFMSTIAAFTPCLEDYYCAYDEVCSSPKKNGIEKSATFICDQAFEQLYNSGDGNWTKVTDPISCENGYFKINDESQPPNAELKCARKKCQFCTEPRNITGGSFHTPSDSSECALIKCNNTNIMLIDDSTYHLSNILKCSSSRRSLWDAGKTKLNISTVQCIGKVNCDVITPVRSNCSGIELCTTPNLTDINRPSCEKGALIYVDSESDNSTVLSSISCDVNTGLWRLNDTNNNDVAYGSTIVLQCISVNCNDVTPVVSNCSGLELCTEVNLSDDINDPFCAEGMMNYIDSASNNAIPIADIECDEKNGEWSLIDMHGVDVEFGSTMSILCISAPPEVKIEAKPDDTYKLIVAIAVPVIVIVLVAVFVDWYIHRNAKASNGSGEGTTDNKPEKKPTEQNPNTGAPRRRYLRTFLEEHQKTCKICRIDDIVAN